MTVTANPRSFLAFGVRVARFDDDLHLRDLRDPASLNSIERDYVEDQQRIGLDSYRQWAHDKLQPVDERQRTFADDYAHQHLLLNRLSPIYVPSSKDLVNRTIAGVHEAGATGNRTFTAKILNRKNQHECVREGALEGHHVRNRLNAYVHLALRIIASETGRSSVEYGALVVFRGLQLHAAEAIAAWRLWCEYPEVRREPELHLAGRPGLLKFRHAAMADAVSGHAALGGGPVLRAIVDRLREHLPA